jgi:antitoxin (DNA-binding transcriptional repressor) of toxin-antitoxin stability system
MGLLGPILTESQVPTRLQERPFSQLVRQMEEGEPVLITRNGKPVAQLVPAPKGRRTVLLGGMRDRIRLLPG